MTQNIGYVKNEQNLESYCLWEYKIPEPTGLLFSDSFLNTSKLTTPKTKKTRCIPKTENDSVILKGYKFKFQHKNLQGRK